MNPYSIPGLAPQPGPGSVFLRSFEWAVHSTRRWLPILLLVALAEGAAELAQKALAPGLDLAGLADGLAGWLDPGTLVVSLWTVMTLRRGRFELRAAPARIVALIATGVIPFVLIYAFAGVLAAGATLAGFGELLASRQGPGVRFAIPYLSSSTAQATGALLAGAGSIIALIALIFTVPALLYLLLRLCLASTLAADGLGPFAALGRSWSLTRGQVIWLLRWVIWLIVASLVFGILLLLVAAAGSILTALGDRAIADIGGGLVAGASMPELLVGWLLRGLGFVVGAWTAVLEIAGAAFWVGALEVLERQSEPLAPESASDA